MQKRRVVIVLGGSLVVIAAGITACGDDSVFEATDAGSDGSTSSEGSVSPDGGAPIDASNAQDGSTPSDAGSADADAGKSVDRGPTKMLMPMLPTAPSPNGLFWQYGLDAALYIADENNNAIVRWDDTNGFKKQTTLPDELAPDSGGLGALVRLEDGTFFVTRFGFGTGGGIIYVAGTGDAGMTPGLDVTRRRIGLTLLPDGTLATGYFKGGDGGQVGAVAKLNGFTGTEKDFITNLSKPVGVQYNEGKILVTDQVAGYLVQSTALTLGGQFQDPLDGGPDAGGYDAGSVLDSGLPDVLALLTGGDALCQGPDGSVFAATNTGTVYQITRDGTVTAVPGATGLVSTKGVAYDGANKRLFVGEIDTTNGSSIHIYPIN